MIRRHHFIFSFYLPPRLPLLSRHTSSTETLSNDLVTNTTSSRHDLVAEAFQAPAYCQVIPYFTITPQNSPENSVLYATRLYLNDFVDVCLLSPYFLVFVPTNVFNMAVFRKHDNEERISVCFVCLSIALLFLFSILQCRQIKCNKQVQMPLTFNIFIKLFFLSETE